MRKLKLLITSLFIGITLITFAQPVNGITTFFTSTTTALQANTACTVTKSVTLSGWLLSVSSTSNCGFNWTNISGGDGRVQYLMGFGTLTQATFGSDDGSEFSLQNLKWGVSTSSLTSKGMIFTGYKNGVPAPGATMTATTPSGTGILNTVVVNFTSIAGFNNVDEIRLAPAPGFTCNSILFFEDITVGTASASCITPTLSLTSQSNVLCNGGSTGSATVSASGGSPFTYTWSPSGGNGLTATGLSAGSYTCVVTNSCGLTASTSVSITQPSALVTSTAVTNVACQSGSNGVASITASGGGGGYTYLWSNGGTTSAITGLLAGAYTATVTDANSCKSIKSAIVTQPSALVTSTAVTNVACNGGSNGVASITASGGAGSYSYLWSNGGTTSAITGLLAGAYTATVTDANSCTSIKSAIVTQPSALVTSTAVTNISCNGGSNGVASITASGGAGSYSYLWSNGGTTSAITGLTFGVYTATVTDANSCTSIKSANVTQPSALVTSTAVTNVACNGGSNGVASITASGGVGSYTYLWSNGGTTSAITGLLQGIYTATVTDANSCISIKNVTISQPSLLSANVIVSSILCNGGIASVTVSATGGTTSYTGVGTFTTLAGTQTYTITDANGCSTTTGITITEPLAIVGSQTVTLCDGQSVMVGSNTYTAAGIYTDVLTAINTCDSIVTTNVIINPLPTITVNSGTICIGQSFTIIAGGATVYYFPGGSSVVTPTANTTYSINGTDFNGCISSVPGIVNVTVNALPTLTASTTNTLLCTGETATLSVTGASSYSWSTTETTSDIAVTPSSQTTYTVDGINVNGCSNTATITQDVSLCTGLTSLSLTEAMISVYPNPTNGEFKIELATDSKVIIMSALGQIVVAEDMIIGKHELDIHNQADGIYFIKVTQNNKHQIIKIIKK